MQTQQALPGVLRKRQITSSIVVLVTLRRSGQGSNVTAKRTIFATISILGIVKEKMAVGVAVLEFYRERVSGLAEHFHLEVTQLDGFLSPFDSRRDPLASTRCLMCILKVVFGYRMRTASSNKPLWYSIYRHFITLIMVRF